MFAIQVLTPQAETTDLTSINVSDRLLIYYTSDISFNSTDRWEWNFDASQSPTAVDQVPQTIIGMVEPISATVFRSGIRRFSVSVFRGSVLLVSAQINFNVYGFPTEINGITRLINEQSATYTLNNTLVAQSYAWYLNGRAVSTTNSLIVAFNQTLTKAYIVCIVKNGNGQTKLELNAGVFEPNTVPTFRYQSDVTEKLMFFNKEGDNLNFDLLRDEKTNAPIWDGDMLFHENGSDTFKSLGLYMLEKVEPITYKDSLQTKKIALYNEHGMGLSPAIGTKVLIDRIEVTNVAAGYYTKWLYSPGIDRKFPLGVELLIEDCYHVAVDPNGILQSSAKIMDINSIQVDGTSLFSVVGLKRNAIMVITQSVNTAYNKTYRFGTFKNTQGKTIEIPQGSVQSLNYIKLYNVQQSNNEWNDRLFMDSLYDRKKLSLLNSRKNDGVYTVNYVHDLEANKISQRVLKSNSLNITTSGNDFNGFKIELESNTDKIGVSQNPVDFYPRGINEYDLLSWQSATMNEGTPALLKKGTVFTFENGDDVRNLGFTYRVWSAGLAADILKPHSDSYTGYSIGFRLPVNFFNANNNAINTLDFEFRIEKTNYIPSIKWGKTGISITTAYQRLCDALNATQVVSAKVVNNRVYVFAQNGKQIIFSKTTKFNIVRNLLAQNNPVYGIVNDEWVEITTQNGYTHYRPETNRFYIFYGGSWQILAGTKRILQVEVAEPVDLAFGLLTTTYLTDRVITFEQVSDPTATDDALAQRFVTTNAKSFAEYGVDLYLKQSDLVMERKYTLANLASTSDYITVKAYKKNTLGVYAQTGTADEASTIDYVMVNEPLVEEHILPNTAIWERKIIIKRINSTTGLLLRINGLDLPVAFDNIVAPVGSTSAEDIILDVEETLLDWGNQRFVGTGTLVDESGHSYYEVLESLGVLVWLEESRESYANGSNQYDTIVIQSKYPDVPIQYDVFNTFDTHKILHSEIDFLFIGNALTITINKLAYTVNNGGSLALTLTAWVELYRESLNIEGIVVNVYENTVLQFATRKEKTKLSYSIWVGKTSIVENDLFMITNFRAGRVGTILSGHEITTSGDFQALGFATGMIVHIAGSKFQHNNQEYNVLFVDPKKIGLSYQGGMWNSDDNLGYIATRSGFNWKRDQLPDIPLTNDIVLSSRTFLRFPREGYDAVNRTSFKIRWEGNDKSMFFYDFSGEQLRDKICAYTGSSPLLDSNQTGYLNHVPNRNPLRTTDASVQQTVFDELFYELEHIDEETELNPVPRPIQVFVGYKTDIEGVNTGTIVVERNENIQLTFDTTFNGTNWINAVSFSEANNSLHVENNTINFLQKGFRSGQRVTIAGRDYLNRDKQLIFQNAGLEIELVDVSVATLTFVPLNKAVVDERSHNRVRSILPPFRDRDGALSLTMTVQPKPIARIRLKAQTEIEDERYKVMLNNLGYGTQEKDSFIFKDYDIKEKGVDWIFLNAKRREMLSIYPEIYNYLSSYKAIINSINYFGYNDLALNEYYQDVDPTSLRFMKLTKIEIPDIFDNRVEGWSEKDYIKKSLPNNQYSKTKLFNLTYRITDFDGNNVLGYSLDEVLVKLLGLKDWLKKEVMMIGTTIKDLTGTGSSTNGFTITQDIRASERRAIHETITPIDFTIESYLQPVSNNSKTYAIRLNFRANSTEDLPDAYHVKITTYNKTKKGLRSVQIINEFKRDMAPYVFAADETLERYVMVEVSCDNGYGSNYIKKRSYDLKLKTAI